MPTPRVVLPGSEKAPSTHAAKLGPANPAEQAYVLVVLRRKTEPLPITPYGTVADRQQYASAHGANASDFLAVAEFAREYNLEPKEENPAARTVELHGTVGDLSLAFGVNLEQATTGDIVHRVREGNITIPANLAGVIQAVLGLDTRPAARPHFRRLIRPMAGGGTSFSPVAVGQLYNFPPNLEGNGQTIAILELDGGFLQSDITTYFKGLNLPVPKVTAVLIDGQTNAVNKHLPAHPELNADDEVALDIQVAGAIAPRANQVVYFSQGSDASWLKSLNQAIQATPKPAAISISWGGPETSFTSQSKVAFEQAFQDAANLGIPVCVASGDDGSFDGTSGLMVDFPSSAPHALACGGTNLAASGSTITSETVWNSLTTDSAGNTKRIGTGGGVSTFFALPTYQTGINVPARPTGTGAGRGTPDVAGDADPATGYQILVKGVPSTVGGTSAVAPLWAGLIARMAQSLKGPVGFLHPKIYQSSVSSVAFHDITKGDNDSKGLGGLYNAAAGWDACTGLGTPNGVALLKALTSTTPTPTPHPPTPPTPHPPTPHPPTPPTPHPPTPPTPTGSTGVAPALDFPPLPPPEVPPSPMPAQPAPSVPVAGALQGLVSGGNGVALVAVVGLAAVMGMVAATGIVATVAISKDKP